MTTGPGRTLEEPEPMLPVASLALMPLALVAIASVYVPLPFQALLAGLAGGTALAVWLGRKLPRTRFAPRTWGVNVVGVVLVSVLSWIPITRLAVAPGADQAMYSAIGRAIGESSSGLSPAWGEISTGFFPRGYSAILAIVSTATGVAKASLIGAGLALVVFSVSLGAFFRALGLGRYSSVMAAAVTLMCHVPQSFFGFGGNSTTLALGFGLMGSGHLLAAGHQHGDAGLDLVLASLFLTAAIATHPIGGLAPLGLGCAAVLAFLPARRVAALFVPLMLVGAFAALVVKWGPDLSLVERLWIQDYLRGPESVFRNAPLSPWAMLGVARVILGGPFLVLAGGGILASLALPRFRRLGLLALAGAAAFLVVEAIGPYLPLFGSISYALRMLPVLAIILAVPGLALLRLLPRTTLHVAMASLLALGVWTNIRVFQHADPMVTPADLEAIACLGRSVPKGAVIDGAYGDATQWIPALTGHAVTNPHVHISVQDEYDALRRAHPLQTDLHFEGEHLRYGSPLQFPPGGTEICRAGKARLFRQ